MSNRAIDERRAAVRRAGSVNESDRLIYKGECQEKYFSLDRKWRNFS